MPGVHSLGWHHPQPHASGQASPSHSPGRRSPRGCPPQAPFRKSARSPQGSPSGHPAHVAGGRGDLRTGPACQVWCWGPGRVPVPPLAHSKTETQGFGAPKPTDSGPGLGKTGTRFVAQMLPGGLLGGQGWTGTEATSGQLCLVPSWGSTDWARDITHLCHLTAHGAHSSRAAHVLGLPAPGHCRSTTVRGRPGARLHPLSRQLPGSRSLPGHSGAGRGLGTWAP